MPGEGEGQGGGESIARVRVLRTPRGRLTKHGDTESRVSVGRLSPNWEMCSSGLEVPRFSRQLPHVGHR